MRETSQNETITLWKTWVIVQTHQRKKPSFLITELCFGWPVALHNIIKRNEAFGVSLMKKGPWKRGEETSVFLKMDLCTSMSYCLPD